MKVLALTQANCVNVVVPLGQAAAQNQDRQHISRSADPSIHSLWCQLMLLNSEGSICKRRGQCAAHPVHWAGRSVREAQGRAEEVCRSQD